VRVIYIDELGPLAAKTYPGEEWKLGPNRATFESEYGRRGKLWVHGQAFETVDEMTLALGLALDYWNAHLHPYRWKKTLQEQVTLLGGFGIRPSDYNHAN
jgi:hypothetical protein